MNTELNFQPGDDETLQLIQTARVGLWGLGLKALMKEGKAPALTCLDKLASGDAEMQFEVKMTGSTVELQCHYSSHGARLLIVALKLGDSEPTEH